MRVKTVNDNIRESSNPSDPRPPVRGSTLTGGRNRFFDKKLYDSWSEYPDYKGSSKWVGRYRVEILGGTDRGAQIIVWAPKGDLWVHSDDLSADGEFVKFVTANFMHYENAREEYRCLTDNGSIRDLLRRTL